MLIYLAFYWQRFLKTKLTQFANNKYAYLLFLFFSAVNYSCVTFPSFSNTLSIWETWMWPKLGRTNQFAAIMSTIIWSWQSCVSICFTMRTCWWVMNFNDFQLQQINSNLDQFRSGAMCFFLWLALSFAFKFVTLSPKSSIRGLGIRSSVWLLRTWTQCFLKSDIQVKAQLKRLLRVVKTKVAHFQNAVTLKMRIRAQFAGTP